MEKEIVYFLQQDVDGLIKIGYTSGPLRDRLKQFETGNPNRLDLLLILDGGYELEKKLHDRFHEFHERGEWFRPEKELVDFIESERSKIDNSHTSKLQFLEKELELSQDCLVWLYEKYLKIEERWNKYDDLISSVDTPENTVYYNKTLDLVSKLRDEIHEMKLEYIEDMSKRERILKEKEKSLDKELNIHFKHWKIPSSVYHGINCNC